MAYPRNDELVRVAGRLWWFPGTRIGADSEFELARPQGLPAGTRWHRHRGHPVRGRGLA